MAPRSAPGGLISVVICTRNRPAALRGCLLSLTHQTLRPHELLVIDNATPAERSAESALRRLTGNRRVCEESPGVTFARHCGLRHARGEVLRTRLYRWGWACAAFLTKTGHG